MAASPLHLGGGWTDTSLANLEATGTDDVGRQGEILAVGDTGVVLLGTRHGSNYYTCTGVLAATSTWIPVPLDAPIREHFIARRTTGGTAERWHMWDGDGDGGAADDSAVILLSSAGGQIVDYRLRASSTGGVLNVTFFKNGSSVGFTVESLTATANTIDDMQPTDWFWDKGDFISISTSPGGNMGNTPLGITIEWDWSTF